MSIYQKVNQTKIVKTLFCIHFPEGCLSLSNRRAIGEHTSTAVNCIPPAEVALNLAFGDFERNGDIHGHWGRDEGVE